MKQAAEVIIQTLSCIGCVINIVIISTNYFEFETIELTGGYIPYEEVIPSLTLCRLLQPEEIANITSSHDHREVSSVNASTVLKDCHIRSSRLFKTVDCDRDFEVTQSIRKSRFDCHMVHVNNETKYKILDATAVIHDRGKLYSFFISGSLEEQKELMIMAHLMKRPASEFRVSTATELGPSPRNFSLDIEYKVIEMYKLPSPYATNCIDASACLDSSGKRHAWCKSPLCIDQLTITVMSKLQKNIQGVLVQMHTLKTSIIRFEHVPLVRLDYFVLEICSLLGIWLSLSVSILIKSAKGSCPRAKSAQTIKNVAWERIIARPTVHRLCPPNTRQTASKPVEASQRKKTSIFKMSRISARMIVASLFLRELYIISSDFFKYATHMNVRQPRSDLKKYSMISYCASLDQLLNLSLSATKYQVFDETMTNFSIASNRTLQELFQLTPDFKSVIKRCRVRHAPALPIETLRDCNKYFSVIKFYAGQFMCYQFRPHIKFISPGAIEMNSSVLYSVIIQDTFARTHSHYRAIVSQNLPVLSRFLASDSYYKSDKEHITLDTAHYSLELLPAPYDTRCDRENKNYCKRQCMQYEKIKRFSFSHVYERPRNLSVLSYVDLKDPSIADYIDRREKQCSSRCPVFDRCKSSFTSTFKFVKRGEESLELTLLSPRYPLSFVDAEPIYTLYEYLYQITCSTSFWIGFSVISVGQLFLKLVNKILTHREPDRTKFRKQRIKKDYLALKTRGNLSDKFLRVPEAFVKLGGEWLKNGLYTFLLSLGFFCHSFLIGADYFKYPTTMGARVEFESNFTETRVSVCISVDQLSLSGDLSVGNIWTRSPRAEEFMVECAHRGSIPRNLAHLPLNLRRRLMPWINSTALCYEFLRVRKFLSQGLVCYEVQSRTAERHIEYRGQYQIGLNTIFSRFIMNASVSSYQLLVVVSQGPAADQLMFTARLRSAPAKSLSQYYLIEYSKHFTTVAPHPYDMGVHDGQMRMMCHRRCHSEVARKSGINSVYDTLWAANNMSYQVDGNESVECRCQKKCERVVERKSTHVLHTYSFGPFDSSQPLHPNSTIGLWFSTTNRVVYVKTFRPALRLSDFIIYIGSICSIWFGVSALHLIDVSRKSKKQPELRFSCGRLKGQRR